MKNSEKKGRKRRFPQIPVPGGPRGAVLTPKSASDP